MTSPAIHPPRARRWVAAAVALSTLASSDPARAEEPTIDEVRYYPTELPPDGTRTRMLLTGAGLAVGWYGVSLGTSYLFPQAPNARDLRIPVAGPWMALDGVRCAEAERNCREAVLVIRTVFAVLSGVGQAGGLLAMVEGLFLQTGSGSAPARTALERDARTHEPTWQAVPVALPDGAGIELVGRF